MLDTGDNLNRASKPSIAGDRTPRETFTKNRLPVRKLRALESRAQTDVPNVNYPGNKSRIPSRRPAMASTNSQTVQPQLNKPKSNGFDGESRRLAIASTNGLSHVTVGGMYLNAEETRRLACGTGQRSVKRCLNSPGGLSAPTSAVEGSDELTARAPGWRRRKEAVKGSVDASVPSDRRRSRHQGDSTPEFKFGGERMEADVRSDTKRTNGKGLTYQRVPSQPLNALTRNVPTTGKTAGWRATMSTKGPDGLTARVPGLKWQEDAVNELVKPSITSDRDRLHQQGDSTPISESGGETIKTEVRKDEKWMDNEGRTYQRAPYQLLKPLTRNAPATGKKADLRAPMSTESSDGPTTQAPVLRRQGEPVNGSANPSVPSDRARLRHQGDLTPKLEFGGEGIKTDVRSDEKRMDGDGHTSQRVRNRPLDPPTRIAPPTGQTDDLEGPTCAQSGDPRHNDLETCKDSYKKNNKRRKRSAKANGIKDSPCPVETDSNKSCSVDYSNAKAATESCDPSLTASAQRSTKGLTAHCNAFDRRDLWSTVTPNILCVRPPAHSLEEVENPSDHSAIKTDKPPSASITNLTATKADTATNAHTTAYQSTDGTATRASFATDSSIAH